MTAHSSLKSAFPPPKSVLLPTNEPNVVVRPSPLGGFGLFATRPIQPFTHILTDTPLLALKPGEDLPQLFSQYQNLSSSTQQDFLRLSREEKSKDEALATKLRLKGTPSSQIDEMVEVAGIFQANAFNLEENGVVTARAIFPRIARINHSCAPSAHTCYYPSSYNSTPGDIGRNDKGEERAKGSMVLHSARGITVGEEITIAYFNLLMSRWDRQKRAGDWGFKCMCAVCSSPEDGLDESLRTRVRDWIRRQYRVMRADSSTSCKEIDELIDEGRGLIETVEANVTMYPTLPLLWSSIAALYEKRAGVETQIRDNDAARGTCVKNAALAEAKITGIDSPAVRRRLDAMPNNGKWRGWKIETDGDGEMTIARNIL